MKFKDLKKLGFKKNIVPAIESGQEEEYFYYTYDFFKEHEDFCLISNSSDEGRCFVEIQYLNLDSFINTDKPIRFYKKKHVKKLINIIYKGISLQT